MAGTPIIVAEDVTKRFGTHQVLTRVSLPVMERDVVCVVGPSALLVEMWLDDRRAKIS